MVYLSLSAGLLAERARAATDAAIARAGGTASWRTSEAAGRTYALAEVPPQYDAAALRESFSGTVYDRPIVAVALFPTVSEALPAVREAVWGAGRPAGVLATYSCTGGIVIEWDPAVTQPQLVMAAVDVELRRFACGRVAELLSPLPAAVVAAIAAAGLSAPQIVPRRILEIGGERV